MKIFTLLAAAATIATAAPMALADNVPIGWGQPETLGTMCHPLRAVSQSCQSPHVPAALGLAYTGPDTITDGPFGTFPDQP